MTAGPVLLCRSDHSDAAKSIVGGRPPLICPHTTAEVIPAACVEICSLLTLETRALSQANFLQPRWRACTEMPHQSQCAPQMLTTVQISTHRVQACCLELVCMLEVEGGERSCNTKAQITLLHGSRAFVSFAHVMELRHCEYVFTSIPCTEHHKFLSVC